jgi:hypothetical protein
MEEYSDNVELDKISVANLLSELNSEEQKLGENLYQAFNDKSNPEKLKKLVLAGAPVNYRLDYGLEIRLESHFVFELFLLLEGDIGIDKLRENAKKIFGEDAADSYVDYLNTAKDYYDILNSSDELDINNKVMPLNENYKNALIENALDGRANPYYKNGALIVAAGLRDKELVNEILEIGKRSMLSNNKENNNGAAVNFKGFFEDTAIIWSAILLDLGTINLLLKYGAECKNIGVSGSSVLHWVVLAERIYPTPDRTETAKIIIDLLIEGDPEICSNKNKLGKKPSDYAVGALKTYLQFKEFTLQNSTTSVTANIISFLPCDNPYNSSSNQHSSPEGHNNIIKRI